MLLYCKEDPSKPPRIDIKTYYDGGRFVGVHIMFSVFFPLVLLMVATSLVVFPLEEKKTQVSHTLIYLLPISNCSPVPCLLSADEAASTSCWRLII